MSFYRRRRGILEYLSAREADVFDLGVHDILCMKAQNIIGNGSRIPPGIWLGSARLLCSITGDQHKEKLFRDRLVKLEKLGWIKRFWKQGRRGSYPILINKLIVRDVCDTGVKDWKVNAEETTDWQHPVLYSGWETGSEPCVRRVWDVCEACVFLKEVKDRKEVQDSLTTTGYTTEPESPLPVRDPLRPPHSARPPNGAGWSKGEPWVSVASNPIVERLLIILADLLVSNPHSSPTLQQNWLKFYAEDIQRLLELYPQDALEVLIHHSQRPEWRSRVISGKGLVAHHEALAAEAGIAQRSEKPFEVDLDSHE